MKIQTLFHKTVPTGVFYGLQSTKPKNFWSRCLATCRKKLLRSWTPPSHLCKANPHFIKVTLPFDPVALGLPNLEKLAPYNCTRADRSFEVPCHWIHTFPCATLGSHMLTRLHVPAEECDVIDDVTSHFGLTHSSNLTCIYDPNLNRLPKKKKKALTKVNLWLWQKVKIFKINYPTRFFVYISILGSVSLSETWELCNWFNFQKVYFCINLNQSKNFEKGLVLLSFSLWIWGLFLHFRIQNCSNSVILQLLALM